MHSGNDGHGHGREFVADTYAYAHRNAYTDTYGHAYANGDAYPDTYVHAYAITYARGNAYAHTYADSNAYPDTYAYAYAITYADSKLYAHADANALHGKMYTDAEAASDSGAASHGASQSPARRSNSSHVDSHSHGAGFVKHKVGGDRRG